MATSADIIRKVRQEYGQTQLKFANILGISRSALTQLEAGNTKPSFDVLENLSRFYGVNPSIFFSDSNDQGVMFGNQNNLEEIKSFWVKEYGELYDIVSLMRANRVVKQFAGSNVNFESLNEIIMSYAVLDNLNQNIDVNFVDPLKRIYKKLIDLIAEEDSESPNNLEKNKQLRDQIWSLCKLAEQFWGLYGNKLSALFDPLAAQNFGKWQQGNRYDLKKFKYSQEKYLRAFFYLLDHSDELKDVSDFYESEEVFNGNS